ncbi:polysaccharide biosynthesis C-terminal domain-containing protein [candidate division KSB1 bacterium]|nr:polysaccharide biosynthesis C-terminal domain-containing protein [candidate division KSB1 bacterium]
MADPNTKNLLQRTARDSVIYLPAMIIPAVVGIFMLRVFTALFSREQFGYYSTALSTTGLVKTFSVIWLSSSAVRFYQVYVNNKKEKEFFSSLLLATTLSAFLFALTALGILLIIHPGLESELFSTLQAAIISTILTAFFEIFIVIFRVSMQPSKYTLYWVLYVIVKPALGLLLIKKFSFGVEGLFWSWCLTPFFLTFFVFKDLKIRRYLGFHSISRSTLRDMASYGFPLAISNFAIWLLSLSDRYLIEIFRTSEEVGLYGVGFAIPEKTLQFTYMTLMLAAYPIIIENFENRDQHSTQHLITEMSRGYILLITPLMLLLAAMPEQIVLILADKRFVASAQVIPFISIGFYFYGLAMYVQKGLELQKKSKRIAMIALSSGVIAIASNVILIPRFGYFGASMSFLLAYCSYFVMAILLVSKIMPWRPPLRTVFNTVIASSAMVAAIKITLRFDLPLMLKLLSGFFSGLILYAGILHMFGELHKDDLMMFGFKKFR